jgi:DNA-binding SARP family transcriptional activator
VLWDDLPAGKARKQLRQALWQLQTTLNAICGEESARILTVETEWVRITLDDEVWLDIDAFGRAYERLRGIDGKILDPDQADELRRAVALYQGDLLEGWYHSWCVIDRERYRTMHLSMLDKLMATCETRHAYEEAVDYGERILRFDRAREATHLRLMRLHYLKGDRTSALRQFNRCVVALREELDACPAKQTAALYHQIRADRLDDIAEDPISIPATAPASLLNVLQQLDQIQTMLDVIRQSVQQGLLPFDRPQARPATNGYRRG